MSHYDTDFYAWTQAQAAAIRAKDWATVDLEHVAEEIESLGNEQRHAVRSHLRVLLWHLLKWASQPDHRGTSWRTSLLNARVEIADRLEDYPSLRPQVPALLALAYPRARRLASAETGLPLTTFPEMCPWTVAQVLDEAFLPETTKGTP
jgi:Domain of unknown function DUF29